MRGINARSVLPSVVKNMFGEIKQCFFLFFVCVSFVFFLKIKQLFLKISWNDLKYQKTTDCLLKKVLNNYKITNTHELNGTNEKNGMNDECIICIILIYDVLVLYCNFRN